eukprot:g17698.t1
MPSNVEGNIFRTGHSVWIVQINRALAISLPFCSFLGLTSFLSFRTAGSSHNWHFWSWRPRGQTMTDQPVEADKEQPEQQDINFVPHHDLLDAGEYKGIMEKLPEKEQGKQLLTTLVLAISKCDSLKTQLKRKPDTP